MPDTRGVNPESDYQPLVIDDFSAGIYDYSSIAASTPNIAGPKFAADPNFTFSCIALPSGGLGPLPGITETYVWPANFNANPSTTPPQTSYLTGVLIHDELGTGDTEAILICVFDDLGLTYGRSFQAISYILETTTATQIILSNEPTSSGGIFGSPYPAFTRAAAGVEAPFTGTPGALSTLTTLTSTSGFAGFTASGFGSIEAYNANQTSVTHTFTYTGGGAGAGPLTGVVFTAPLTDLVTTGSLITQISQTPTTVAGQPVVVFPSGPPEQPAGVTAIYMYPDPSTPSSYVPLDLITGPPNNQTSVAGQIYVHQSRIICFSATDYTWPGGTTFFTNENINFTDPPNSVQYGNQQTVLAAEEPFGYGAAGSISAGEFFVVKKRGGGLVVTGDIFSPNVTLLPGVQSTGNIVGQAASTPMGFVYCSYNNGAWVWNGGSQSNKISTQLDDNFFLPPEFSSGMKSNNYAYYVSNFGDKLYFNNNWILDTRTNSWWRYYPTKAQGGADLFWTQEVNGDFIYAAQLSFVHPGLDFMYRFDPTSPTHSYQWQSLPIRLTQNRLVQARTITVIASSNKGNNTAAQVKVSIFNGATEVASVTSPTSTIGPAPTMIRMPIGGVNAPFPTPYTSEDITVRINGIGGSGAAPNIISCHIDWEERQHSPTVGVSA